MMSSILTDLEAALEAVDAARKTLALPLPISEVAYLEREEALYSALGTFHKLATEDTIAALVAVAKRFGTLVELAWQAVDATSNRASCGENIVELMDEEGDYLFIEKSAARKLSDFMYDEGGSALAPLVKEADDG